MDADKFRGQMHSLAYGTAMEAAARDYYKMKLEEEEAAKAANKYSEVDLEDLENDDELEQLHRERLMKLKAEQEKRQELNRKGHGEYREIEESEFLTEVTGTDLVVCHFYHTEFERCRIVDKHLKILAPKYFETKFVKISAPDAPFFVAKLQVQVLPCLVLFKNGVAFDRIVGFEEFKSRDDFDTHIVEKRLLAAEILKKKVKTEDDSDDEDFDNGPRRILGALQQTRDSDDEDSDFSDEE